MQGAVFRKKKKSLILNGLRSDNAVGCDLSHFRFSVTQFFYTNFGSFFIKQSAVFFLKTRSLSFSAFSVHSFIQFHVPNIKRHAFFQIIILAFH